jgi:hypothetical protein
MHPPTTSTPHPKRAMGCSDAHKMAISFRYECNKDGEPHKWDGKGKKKTRREETRKRRKFAHHGNKRGEATLRLRTKQFREDLKMAQRVEQRWRKTSERWRSVSLADSDGKHGLGSHYRRKQNRLEGAPPQSLAKITSGSVTRPAGFDVRRHQGTEGHNAALGNSRSRTPTVFGCLR